MKNIKSFIFASLIILCVNAFLFAQQNGSLAGQVYDSLGAVLVGATVIAVDSTGKEKSVVTNRQGEFVINGLAPGKYTIRATAPKFSLYESTDFEITAGNKSELIIAMTIAAIESQVNVGNEGQVDTDPSNNASQTVLTEKEIKDLPDDPDELAAYLQAMAGPGAGPDGAQISIDGFSGGRMPPKEAIREIRFNQNPFSAEYDRIGFSRVEILTKPGFEKFGGGANFNFNDESLNSRSPFALKRAPSQMRNFGGNLRGPIQSKKSAFFVDFNYGQNDTSNLIYATILDSSNRIVDFRQEINIPSRRLSFSPRLDFTLNDKNTISGRYGFSRSTSENQGVGTFSLPSRAFNRTNSQQEIQLTESMIVNSKTVNETRFQYEYNNSQQNGDISTPSISVSNAFQGGGSQMGLSYTKSKRWELQNYTTTTLGKNAEHPIKFGVRVRGIDISSQNQNGYGGTFSFTGVYFCLDQDGKPCLNPNGTQVSQPIPLVDGTIINRPLTSIEQFQQKVLGNTDPRFNPNVFSIVGGNPLADISQLDYGVFITDDWKVRNNLTLSMGLRYENQTNISDNFNFAPRIGIAWQPGAGGARQPKTVIRGGFGIFYNRFGENTTLTARRFDGVSQINYTVFNSPGILGQSVFTYDGVTNVPAISQLNPNTSIPYKIDNGVQSSYSIQSVISVERQLPFKTTFSATFFNSRNLHLLQVRNINAPVCPPSVICPQTLSAIQPLRPDPTKGNVYQYETSGYANSQRLVFNFMNRLNQNIMLFGNYSLNFSKSNTDSNPAYSYDLTGEYVESLNNARHIVFIGGSIGLPWGIRLSPTININSKQKFNIVTGQDTNQDSFFTERPTYSQLKSACDRFQITALYCDIGGINSPDNTIIPKNYGDAPGNFTVSLGLNKTFGFGGSPTPAQNGQGNAGGGNRGGGNRGGGGQQVVMMGGGGGGFFGGGDTRKPYNLTLGINVRNLFNTVNFAAPQGSLTSPYFGQSLSTYGGSFGSFGRGGSGGAANRRIDLSLRFNW